jgi:hypothetical protein
MVELMGGGDEGDELAAVHPEDEGELAHHLPTYRGKGAVMIGVKRFHGILAPRASR